MMDEEWRVKRDVALIRKAGWTYFPVEQRWMRPLDAYGPRCRWQEAETIANALALTKEAA